MPQNSDNNENMSEEHIFNISENDVFVKLLSKYRVILGSRSAPIKTAAAQRLAKEYNKIYGPNKMTVKRVLKKICNMKSRLKEKNVKVSRGNKRLKYRSWELHFSDIWTADESKEENNSVSISNDESLSNDISIPNDVSTLNDICITNVTNDVLMKVEEDEFVLPENTEFVTDNSIINHNNEYDRKPEPESDYKEPENYDKMSLDELQKLALISQIKMYKEQEKAARSKKTLNDYKLVCLQRERELHNS